MKKLYILYDWSNEEKLRVSYSKDKILAKIGESAFDGEFIDNYKIIEIDLDEVED